MAITAKDSGTTFIPHNEGQYPAVCCDVVDLGMVKTTFAGETKEQHKIRVVFYTDDTHPETGDPMTVSERFTLSLYEKANLRKFLESWRGKPYQEEEARAGVDVEKMIGVAALLQVTHKTRNGKTYANISSVMRLPKSMESPPINPKYVRVKDRKPEEQRQTEAPPPDDDDEDSLPF